MLIGTQLAARVSRRAEPRHIVMISTAGLGVSALAIVGGALLAPSSLLAVMIPLWGFTFFLGVNTPCIQTMALSRHGDSAGAASSLLNATRQGFGVVATPITGLVGMKSALPLGLIMLIAQAVALVVLWVVVRPHKLESLG